MCGITLEVAPPNITTPFEGFIGQFTSWRCTLLALRCQLTLELSRQCQTSICLLCARHCSGRALHLTKHRSCRRGYEISCSRERVAFELGPADKADSLTSRPQLERRPVIFLANRARKGRFRRVFGRGMSQL